MTSSTSSSSLYYFPVQPCPSGHSCQCSAPVPLSSTKLLSSSPISFLLLLHPFMLLVVLLYLLLPPLTRSVFFNGMLEVFELETYNYSTLSRFNLWILSLSSNPTLTRFPFSGYSALQSDHTNSQAKFFFPLLRVALASAERCSTETTFSFSAISVCFSCSAEACAIPQTLRWFRHHICRIQQVCHFSRLLLSDENTLSYPHHSVLSSVFLQALWQDLSFLSSFIIRVQWVPGH